MKKINFLSKALIIGAILLGFSSCDDDDVEEVNYTMSNQDFVTRASSGNMFEIAAGGLAVNQGVNAEVKHFGEHMVTDHGKTATEMQALVRDKGWTMPTNMLAEHERMIDTLEGLSGAAFDKKFAAMMVVSHRQTIALFEQAAESRGVPDGQLRGFASGKLPVLKEHLDGAVELQTNVNKL